MLTETYQAALPLKNANYDKVISAMDKLLGARYRNACSCRRCLSDIAAMALNILPPHYYVDADRREGFGSPWIMVECAVVEAIGRVMENPRHGLADGGAHGN